MLIITSLLLLSVSQAQPAEPASQAEAQRILAEAIEGETIDLSDFRTTLTGRYHAEASPPSEPCVTRYRLEAPQRFRDYQGMDAGPPVRVPVADASTIRKHVDWSFIASTEPSPANPGAIIAHGRPAPYANEPSREVLPVRAESRARALAAANYLIRTCYRAPRPPGMNPFIFLTGTGTQQRFPINTTAEVTRQLIATPENDSTGRYGNALLLLAGTGARYRVSWQAPVPIQIEIPSDDYPDKAEMRLTPGAPTPTASGSVEVTFIRNGVGLLGLTQPRSPSATGDRFGNDYRPYTVTVTKLD
jgi:hypothetical protein